MNVSKALKEYAENFNIVFFARIIVIKLKIFLSFQVTLNHDLKLEEDCQKALEDFIRETEVINITND